ncbi:MAG: glycosyltransferase family 4 protein [Deltaproteobacteria bacterium]|nr:glycosyltransferase family 4 protein [Deltaproteobacteria bacterium]
MKVALLNITSGRLSEGYRTYLKHILPRMFSHPQISDLLVGMPEAIDMYEWEQKFPSAQWIKFKTSILSSSGIRDDIKERIIMFSPEVIFIPTMRFLRINSIPTVNMIRNMGSFFYSNERGMPITETLINCLRRRATRNAVVNADRIIAVSKFVKDFLISQWKISPNRIGIVYHGVELNQKGSKMVKPSSIPKGWEGKFLFTAGSIRPQRGLQDIILAMRHLLVYKNDIIGLLIAGHTNSNMIKFREHLESLIKKYNIEDRIFWLGKLNTSQMRWCYQNCRVFVMTSRVEACPNTALEAMSNGCLCVSTNNSPMPEIFGDAAIYYPVGDEETLSKTLKDILVWNDNQRKEASERARKRAANFSWDICAEKTIAELAKVVRKEKICSRSSRSLEN